LWRNRQGDRIAGSEERFSKARLEALSNGVIAAIVTVIVFDVESSESAPAPLLKL
jgi:uncharacterized membrane protein